MTRDKLTSLLKEYDKLLFRHKGESVESIKKLKAVVGCCADRGDFESAYRYQQKVCDACAQVYGQTDIMVERAQLYRRQLMIQSAPLGERVRLCREFWRDAINEYGENSDVVRKVAQLYLACCCDADEMEELKIVCSEVVAIFSENEDEESRWLVASCGDYDVFIGERSGDLQEMQAAGQRAKAALGRDSAYELCVQCEIANKYRREGQYERAAELHGETFRSSREKLGKYATDTLNFQKYYIMALACAGRFRAALLEAGNLKRAVKRCEVRNLCPDIYECYAFIYMKMGKERLYIKYSRKSLEFCERNYGMDDERTLKSRYLIATETLVRCPNDSAAFNTMIEYMTAKEQSLYNIFLLSSEVVREKYFSAQNRGEYDLCLGIVLGIWEKSSDSGRLSALWEVVCNYKTLVGDCEFLHSALRQRENISGEIEALRDAIQSSDRSVVTAAERRLLELSKSADFPGYVNAVNVRDIQDVLQEDEILLDYYCVHFSDLEVYAVIAATRHSLALFQLDRIDKVDDLIRQLALNICSENGPGALDGGGRGMDSPDETFHDLISRLFESIVPKIQMPNRVIICPDGELYRLSFELLMGTAQVVYVTNPKDIARGRKSAPCEKPPIASVKVFADPLFSLTEEPTEEILPERSGKLARLPGTFVEAAIIQRIYGDRARIYTRFNANKQMFLQNCNADTVHIGTHASSTDGGVLFFSGANEPAGDAERPVSGKGCLTSTDIAGLNMGNTRLVVLSACQTGIGEYRSYLGVRGLRRAFQIAGAASVAATLWNISDMATAVFMYEFYMKYSQCGDSVASLYYAKNYIRRASVREMREQVYPVISEILINSDNMETYREFRDMMLYGRDEATPFSAPYYWAAFSIFDSFVN